MWTSDNQLALLGIIAHCLNKKVWKVQSRLLALKEVHGNHSGENMASYVSKVVNDYGIAEEIGFFTLDNVPSNDMCLDTFLQAIIPGVTDDDIKVRRIRCLGHIINLAAEAFLLGKNPDAFEVENATNRALERYPEEAEAWRKHGPVGKLHNIATWIKRSPQRIALFKKVSQGLEAESQSTFSENMTTNAPGIIVDNATRWNSTLYMIKRGLEVRDALEMSILRLDRDGDVAACVPHENRLSSDNWLILAETADILKPFEQLTKWLQSKAKDATHGSV